MRVAVDGSSGGARRMQSLRVLTAEVPNKTTFPQDITSIHHLHALSAMKAGQESRLKNSACELPGEQSLPGH